MSNKTVCIPLSRALQSAGVRIDTERKWVWLFSTMQQNGNPDNYKAVRNIGYFDYVAPAPDLAELMDWLRERWDLGSVGLWPYVGFQEVELHSENAHHLGGKFWIDHKAPQDNLAEAILWLIREGVVTP